MCDDAFHAQRDKDEKEAAKLIRLQNHVETVIGDEQRSRKRALTRDEKAAVMRREIDQRILVEGRWFGSESVSRPMVTPDELRRSIIKLDGRDFRLATIPQGDYDGIVGAARRAGVRVTPELIAEKWAELLRRRRVDGKPVQGPPRELSSVEQKVLSTAAEAVDSFIFPFPFGLLPRASKGSPQAEPRETLSSKKERPILPPMEGRHQRGE